MNFEDGNPIIENILSRITNKDNLIKILQNLSVEDCNEIIVPFVQKNLDKAFVCNVCKKIFIRNKEFCSKCLLTRCKHCYWEDKSCNC